MKTSLHLLTKIIALLIYITIPVTTWAQWSAPVNLSPNAISAGLNESMGSCIGVSGDTVHVVWTDKLSSTKAAIYYTRSLNTGLTWSNAIRITSINGNAWNPAIAVNGSSVHVVWRNIDTVTNARTSWYKHSLDGGNTWATEVYIDSTSDWPAVAVSGNNVYIANDRHITTANSEIFFLRSTNNGLTWSGEQQLTFANLRSEDEAIHAEGSHVYMSWNDNRTGQFQIFHKESADYGVTWGPDVVVDLPFDYNTMVWSNGTHVDVIAAGASSGRYQVLLAQSADTGATWGTTMNLTNDTAHTYYLPDMVRDRSDLHVVAGSSAGEKYLHSANGGTTWDTPFTFTGGGGFVAYTGCVVHIIYGNTSRVYYIRNPIANSPPSLNLKFFIEGYYLTGGLMKKVLHNEGIDANASSTNVDTVLVELRPAANTSTVAASYKGVLQINGTLACSFPCSVFGNTYYIAVKHRNAVQTWSAAPVYFSEATAYDFTTANTKAYGSNLIQMEPGKWAFYSGDINQNGNVDLLDFPPLDSGINSGLSGYYETDLNGDGNVDLLDFPLLDANINRGVFSIHP